MYTQIQRHAYIFTHAHTNIHARRELLSLTHGQRDKALTEELLSYFDSSDFLMQFPKDLQKALIDTMTIEDVPKGHVIIKQVLVAGLHASVQNLCICVCACPGHQSLL